VVVPADDTERKAVEMFVDHFEEELNVKRVSFRDHADDIVKVAVEPNMKTFGPKFGRSTAAAKEAVAKADPREIDAALARGASFMLCVDGAMVALEPTDVVIKKSYGEAWAGAADGKTVVLLDKRITPALRNEGHARDIVRNVQNLRKDAGLDIADRIVLGLVTSSKELAEAIAQFREYIAEETLAVEVQPVAPRNAVRSVDVDIEGQKLTVGLAKQ
jgi:isoleucyl-tRNA synthetase